MRHHPALHFLKRNGRGGGAYIKEKTHRRGSDFIDFSFESWLLLINLQNAMVCANCLLLLFSFLDGVYVEPWIADRTRRRIKGSILLL